MYHGVGKWSETKQRTGSKGTESKPAVGHGRAVPAPRLLPGVPPGLTSAAGEAPRALRLGASGGETVSGLKETAAHPGKARGRKFLAVHCSRSIGNRLVWAAG